MIEPIQYSEGLSVANVLDETRFLVALRSAALVVSSYGGSEEASVLGAVPLPVIRVTHYLPPDILSTLRNWSPEAGFDAPEAKRNLIEDIVVVLDKSLLNDATFWKEESFGAVRLSQQSLDLIKKCAKYDTSKGTASNHLTTVRTRNLCLLADAFADAITPKRGGRGANVALEKFFLHYRERIVERIQALNIGLSDAEELTDAFIHEKILVRPESFLNQAKREYGHFRGFLRLHLRNHVVDWRRRRHRLVFLGEGDNEQDASEIDRVFSDGTTPEHLAVIFSDHQEAERVVRENVENDLLFQYLMVGGRLSTVSQEELAELLGLRCGALRVYLWRIRRKLSAGLHQAARNDSGHKQDVVEICAGLRRHVNLSESICPHCELL